MLLGDNKEEKKTIVMVKVLLNPQACLQAEDISRIN